MVWRSRRNGSAAVAEAVGTLGRQIDVGDLSLHWAETGEGPPVLFLHGLGDSHRTWRKLWPEFPGRRVLMLDLAGHGESDRPDAPYTLEWHAAQVARFIERLGLVDLDVVGHSYGGGVAQTLLLTSRRRIRRVALIASGGLGRAVDTWLRLASAPYLVESLGQPWIGRVARFAIARATTSDESAELEMLSAYLSQPGTARAFARTVHDVIGWRGQTRHLFERVEAIGDLPPMRLFWGERDDILPSSQGIALSRRLEGCALVRFPDAGHFIQWEQPVALAEHLRAFLDGSGIRATRLRPSAMRSADR